MRCRSVSLPVAVLALAAACDFVPDPVALEELPFRVTVHSLLTGGRDTAKVLITRVGDFDPNFGSSDYAVSDARVRLVGPDGAVGLAEDATGAPRCTSLWMAGADSIPSAGPGCYAAAVPGGIRAGVPYALHIELPDGARVEGSAMAIAPPAVRSPTADTRVTLDTMRSDRYRRVGATVTARWTMPARAALATVWFRTPDVVFRADSIVSDASCRIPATVSDGEWFGASPGIGGDSAVVVVRQPDCRVPSDSVGTLPLEGWDSLHVRMRVMVYDSTYVAYVREIVEARGPVEEARAGLGLDGAAGVFAGAGAADRRITVVAPPDTSSAPAR